MFMVMLSFTTGLDKQDLDSYAHIKSQYVKMEMHSKRIRTKQYCFKSRNKY